MIKYLAIPLILVGCTAPVTHPPAEACSPRLDGEPTFCPEPGDIPFDPKPKPLLPKEEIRGEIDIYEPMHWHQMQMMFQTLVFYLLVATHVQVRPTDQEL